MVVLHDAKVLLVVCQVEVLSFAKSCATKTNGLFKLFLRFCEATVVKAEFFSERDFLVREHANRVGAISDFVDGLAIRATAVTESAGVVAVQNGIDSEDVITSWIIEVTLESYIVEVRQIFGQLLRILALLDDILLLKPMPWPIDLTEVLNNE
jgi:hypothetical protein